MNSQNSDGSGEQLEQELERGLVDRYGPVLGGHALRQVLGYPTAAALRQAVLRGTLRVPVFEIPNRRGRFALARDVAAWLARCRRTAITAGDTSGQSRGRKKEDAMP